MSDSDTAAQERTGASTDITVEEIDKTRDTNESVFEAESDRASMTFLFPRRFEHDLLVHTVRSDEPGGMKELMDHVCQTYDCELVRFSTPLGDTLERKLNGFEKVVETIEDGRLAGEQWVCLDGRWEVD